MNGLFAIPFLFVAVQDTTKVDTILRPIVSIFEQSKSEQIQKQFDVSIVKMDTMNAKLDSIILKLQKRKNDTLNRY